MAYRLRLHEGQVLPYLRGRDSLSRNGRVRLFTNLHLRLGEMTDPYRQDPERRLTPGSPTSGSTSSSGTRTPIDYVEEGNPFGPANSA